MTSAMVAAVLRAGMATSARALGSLAPLRHPLLCDVPCPHLPSLALCRRFEGQHRRVSRAPGARAALGGGWVSGGAC